jgi:hypothetical protein
MPTTPGMPRWHCGGVGFALAIGAGTGRPHGGQHRHRGPWPVRVTQTTAEPPSSPMAAWGLRLVNRSTSSPLWLGLLSGSTFFSAFREHNVHAHDYDHNHQSPPPRLLALSKATKKDTRAQFAKDTPVLSRDIFSPCSKAIPSLSQPPLPSRPEYGCLSNTMP